MARARQAELGQNTAADGLIIVPCIIGVLHLGVGGTVLHIEPFKGGHGAAAEQRRKLAAPQIPQKVLSALAGGAALGRIVAPAGTGVAVVHEGPAGVAVTFKSLHGKGAPAGHGHSPVVEQIAVLNVVHAALGVQELHMLLQLFALAERAHQFAQHQLLVRVQRRRVGGVHRGEGCIPQGVLLLPDLHGVLFPVDAAQVVAALHLEVRVAVDDLTLQLEHQDADGLVHHGTAVQHSFCIGAAGSVGVGHPDGKVVLAVILLGHTLQVAQVDAVAILDHAVVVVGQRGLEHGADADGAAGRRAHPHHVVVAPLDVHVMVAHEQIEDDIRAPAVEQIAHDVQLVHSQVLDELTQPHDEAVGTAVFNDAAHDLTIVQVLVVVLEMGVEQLVQNVAAAGGQALAHMLPGVFGGHQTADIDEPQQCFGIPLVQRFFVGTAGLELGQFFIRVIDQGGQLSAGVFRHGLAQHLIHLFADDAGGRVQDVHKSFVFAVQVAHEVFRALGQLEQGLRADDLAGRCRLRWVIPREQGQVFQVVTNLVGLGAHGLLHRQQRSACGPPQGPCKDVAFHVLFFPYLIV